MDGKKLESIANGLYAAARIQNIYNTAGASSETRSGDRMNNMLRQSLETIIQYSPDSFRNKMSEILSKSITYSDTYRNLKGHFNRNKYRSGEESANTPPADNIMRALEIIKPATGEQSSDLIDKIIKIYDIISS